MLSQFLGLNKTTVKRISVQPKATSSRSSSSAHISSSLSSKASLKDASPEIPFTPLEKRSPKQVRESNWQFVHSSFAISHSNKPDWDYDSKIENEEQVSLLSPENYHDDDEIMKQFWNEDKDEHEIKIPEANKLISWISTLLAKTCERNQLKYVSSSPVHPWFSKDLKSSSIEDFISSCVRSLGADESAILAMLYNLDKFCNGNDEILNFKNVKRILLMSLCLATKTLHENKSAAGVEVSYNNKALFELLKMHLPKISAKETIKEFNEAERYYLDKVDFDVFSNSAKGKAYVEKALKRYYKYENENSKNSSRRLAS